MILAIDCGSTLHKAALFDEQLSRLADASLPVSYTARAPDRAEFDPERIWSDTVGLIKSVCRTASVSTKAIRTVALASQAQTFTLLNRADEPITRFLSWMDARALEEAAELARGLGDRFHKHCSFPSPLPQLQLAKLLWLARRFSPRQLSDARVVTLPSFLALRLAGLHCVDTNLAAMSGLFSLANNGWWNAALAACAMKSHQFGSLVKPGTAVAGRRHCPDLDLARDLEIVFAGNDQSASAFANRAEPGRCVVTLGTALVAYRFAGSEPGPFTSGGCWGPYPGGGHYELVARDEGCAALQWAADELTGGNLPRFLELAAGANPGRACFFPQKIGNSNVWSGSELPADRSRAVLEGICFSLRAMLDALPSTDFGTEIIVTGGGSANPFWLAMLANILNRPVQRGMGDALLGAALLARPEARPQKSTASRIFSPEPVSAGEYQKCYDAWIEQAYSALATP